MLFEEKYSACDKYQSVVKSSEKGKTHYLENKSGFPVYQFQFLGVVFYLTEHGGILNFLILNSPGAIITGLGIYFLYRHNHPEYVKRINKRKYIKFQRKLEKNHDKIIHSLEKQSRIIRMKASKHRGLMWDVYFRRTVYFGLASVILVLLAFFNIAPFYVAALIIALCAFIYSVSGMGYRKTLKAYEAVYKSAAEAKESFC